VPEERPGERAALRVAGAGSRKRGAGAISSSSGMGARRAAASGNGGENPGQGVGAKDVALDAVRSRASHPRASFCGGVSWYAGGWGDGFQRVERGGRWRPFALLERQSPARGTMARTEQKRFLRSSRRLRRGRMQRPRRRMGLDRAAPDPWEMASEGAATSSGRRQRERTTSRKGEHGGSIATTVLESGLDSSLGPNYWACSVAATRHGFRWKIRDGRIEPSWRGHGSA